MKNKKPVCRSKTIPCPAGERCPQHRGLLHAILQAAEGQNLEEFLALKDELSDEEKKRRQHFLQNLKFKTNKDGTGTVIVPGMQEVFWEKATNNGLKETTWSLTKPGKTRKVTFPLPHPADTVDKNLRISTSVGLFDTTDYKVSPHEKVVANAQTIYGGGIENFDCKLEDGDYVYRNMKLAPGYENRGVEAHVLLSSVAAQRDDLYSFFGDDSVPYEAYEKAGFEPNPYYWAGKTHPTTGKTYPSIDVLKKLNNWDTNSNCADLYSSLYGASRKPDMPYVRTHSMSPQFKDLPWDLPSAQKLSKDQKANVSKVVGERFDLYTKFKTSIFHYDRE